MYAIFAITLIFTVLTCPAGAIGLREMLDGLGDLSAPVEWTDRTLGRLSSADPNLGPADHDHFLPGTTEDEAVLARMSGPGCIPIPHAESCLVTSKGYKGFDVGGLLAPDRRLSGASGPLPCSSRYSGPHWPHLVLGGGRQRLPGHLATPRCSVTSL